MVAILHEELYEKATTSLTMESNPESPVLWAQFITPEKFIWAQGHDLRVTLGSLGDDLNLCLSEYARKTEEVVAVTPEAKELFDALEGALEEDKVRSPTVRGPDLDQLAQGFYRMIGKLQIMHKDDPDFSVEDLERVVHALVRAAKREERDKLKSSEPKADKYLTLGDLQQYFNSLFGASKSAGCGINEGLLSGSRANVDEFAGWDSKLPVDEFEECCDTNDNACMQACGTDDIIRVTDNGFVVHYQGAVLPSDDAVIIDWDSGAPRVTLTLVADRIVIE